MDQIFVVQPEKTEASRDRGMRTSLKGLLWVTKGTIFGDEKMCTLSVFMYYELRKYECFYETKTLILLLHFIYITYSLLEYTQRHTCFQKY